MANVLWNPWHGCHRYSEGCAHCYVFRMDAKYNRDSDIVVKTKQFNLPLAKDRHGNWKYPAGTQFDTCFTSDFFLEEADEWRREAWEIMRLRSDCRFFFITKRIVRIYECLPEDWDQGYPHVQINCTTENQHQADLRLPIFLNAPICHKGIVCEPILGPIDLTAYLTSQIQQVIVGGESGDLARDCNYDWVVSLSRQCRNHQINFYFKQTGAHFIKDNKRYTIKRSLQMPQAKKAGLNYTYTTSSFRVAPSKTKSVE